MPRRLAARSQSRRALASARRQVDELRGEHGRRGGSQAARRRRGDLRRLRRLRARGHRHEHVVEERSDAVHAGARPRHPRRSHARPCSSSPRRAATRSRKAPTILEDVLGADEAFTSSSVREVMPLIEVDGVALGRGPAADELQRRCAPPRRRRSASVRDAVAAGLVGTLSACQRARSGLAAWRSRTACSSGPTSWAAAVRTRTASCTSRPGRNRASGTRWTHRCCVGHFVSLKRSRCFPWFDALPQARFPFARPAVVGSIVASSLVARGLRRSTLSPGGKEVAAGAVSLLPAVLALRGSGLAEYHGAEHVSIGTYENDARAPKEHPRCGSQLIAPMLASSLAANVAAAWAPAAARGFARLLGTDGRHRSLRRGLRVDDPESGEPARESSGSARARAATPLLHGGAVGRTGRGRRCGPRRACLALER